MDSNLDIIYETLPNTFLDLHNYLLLQRDFNAITCLKIDLINKRKMNEIIWISAKKDVVRHFTEKL